MVNSDLAVYFNEAEMAEMAVEDIDSEHLYLQDLGMDIATAPTSYPSTRGGLAPAWISGLWTSHARLWSMNEELAHKSFQPK